MRRPVETLALLAALTLPLAAGAGAEPGVRDAVERALDVQGDLLKQTEREQDAASPEPLSLDDQADPRIAPAVPAERELPEAIFEASNVTVASGTWGNARTLRLRKLVLDADLDGTPELVRWRDPESGLVVRQEQDRNYDGVVDEWTDYEWGAAVARVLDSNDDGNPDVWERYQNGRMTARETDRDDDGVRDAFYRYQGESLVEERHDANNDGQIDLVIYYEDRRRTRAEEDQDRDGRMDTWTRYDVVGDVELVAQIERDKQGRGFPDTFETFEARDGQALLTRREEDLDGDSEIDVVSIYQNGKLVRREITNPDVVPL